jgi:predicted porin
MSIHSPRFRASPSAHLHVFVGAQARTLLLLTLLAPGLAAAATVVDTERARVEVYGILDVGVGYLEHSYAQSDVLASTVNSFNLNSSPNSWTGIYSGGFSMSRVGFRGEAEFGTGQKVFFRLESAINVNTGNLSNNGQAIYNNINGLKTANSASAINGQLFSRAAYLGVSDPHWGSLELGRTTNFSLDQTAAFDPLRAALLYSPLGYSGAVGGGLGATENSRLDDSIRYENAIKGLSFGAQYKFKGDRNTQSVGYGWVGMLGYTIGGFSIEGTYSETTNSVTWPIAYSNVVAPDPNVQVENTKGYMVTVKYSAGPATIKAGYESQTIWAPSDRHLDIQVYYGLFLPKPSVNAAGQQYLSLYWIGGDYRLTRDFDLSVGFYNIDTYNSPEVGKAYWATAYSLLADYDLSKHFDAYFGIMAMQYSGAGLYKHAPINAFSNNAMYGVGIRFKF